MPTLEFKRIVIGSKVDPALVMSGQITVSTAGTAVHGDDIDLDNGVYIKALAGNTGVVYAGNDGAGDVTSANGFQLSQTELFFFPVANLSDLWFDAATSGDKICWARG